MNTIAEVITALLLFIIYPVLVLGTLLWLLFAIRNIVLAYNPETQIRRIAAAVLPLTILIFSIVLTGDAPHSVYWTQLDNWVTLLSIGAGMGILTMVSASWFSRRDSELAPVMHTLFLSTVICFLLYCIMQQTVVNLQFFFLGMIVAFCLYLMFRGADDLGVFQNPAAQRVIYSPEGRPLSPQTLQHYAPAMSPADPTPEAPPPQPTS